MDKKWKLSELFWKIYGIEIESKTQIFILKILRLINELRKLSLHLWKILFMLLSFKCFHKIMHV